MAWRSGIKYLKQMVDSVLLILFNTPSVKIRPDISFRFQFQIAFTVENNMYTRADFQCFNFQFANIFQEEIISHSNKSIFNFGWCKKIDWFTAKIKERLSVQQNISRVVYTYKLRLCPVDRKKLQFFSFWMICFSGSFYISDCFQRRW